MALSDSGRLFGAGYNDRGQLGLGHRINTAKFQQVRTFADRRVLQVVCGQQHTIARVESSTGAKESTLSEVFVWGNGVLGQLGLGRRGISKGRLVPHRLATLDDQNVIDIAAGANHSLALSDTGDVFFWGHTEYGQSGRTKSSAGDYEVGGHLKFYIPGKVEGFGSSHIKKIACGSTFSLALSESGHVYSFGWNESGVLGMGTSGRTALSPSRIPFLGPPHTPPCVDISCGHVHAFAVTDVRSAHLPMLRPLLGQPSGDVALVVKDGRNRALKSFLNDVKSKTGGAEPRKAEPVEEIFFAHSFILASRCEFFRDLILHARDAGSYLADADGKGVSVLDSAGGATTDAEEDCPKKILLELEEREWSKATVRAMLIYLYTEELICPPHRYHALRALAVRLGLEHLVYILSEADRSLDALAWRPIDQPEKESDPVVRKCRPRLRDKHRTQPDGAADASGEHLRARSREERGGAQWSRSDESPRRSRRRRVLHRSARAGLLPGLQGTGRRAGGDRASEDASRRCQGRSGRRWPNRHVPSAQGRAPPDSLLPRTDDRRFP
mmetsp:Transcript_15286/g.58156  ORF Transcript_15286/g.58156 Transcript_15286/m.58156 type:complete len:555 (+) Transcript_15286:766-2430(+)